MMAESIDAANVVMKVVAKCPADQGADDAEEVEKALSEVSMTIPHTSLIGIQELTNVSRPKAIELCQPDAHRCVDTNDPGEVEEIVDYSNEDRYLCYRHDGAHA